jgi:hypothetical protein
MNSPDSMNVAQKQMDDALAAYVDRARFDSELHQHLIEDLKAATTLFLELRRQFFLGRG